MPILRWPGTLRASSRHLLGPIDAQSMTTTTETATQTAPQPAAPPTACADRFTDGPLRKPLAKLTKVSIVIPVYNEEATIQDAGRPGRQRAAARRACAREIICVNDCSKDGTAAKLDELPALFPDVDFKIFHKPVNEGKGAALRDGFKHATRRRRPDSGCRPGIRPAGLPQAAPADRRGQGRRGLRQPVHRRAAPRALLLAHARATSSSPAISNMFTNLNLTDMEVCYKVFRKTVLDQITDQVQPLRLRAGDHRQGRQDPPAAADLRSRRRLLRPQLRRRQKDHLERRHQGDPDDHPVPVFELDGVVSCQLSVVSSQRRSLQLRH